MDRAEHLAWSKRRALAYVDAGDTTNAINSMLSDLRKHPDLRDHAAIGLTVMMMMSGLLSNSDEVRKHIEGFN
jgi:hypothetical protein